MFCDWSVARLHVYQTISYRILSIINSPSTLHSGQSSFELSPIVLSRPFWPVQHIQTRKLLLNGYIRGGKKIPTAARLEMERADKGRPEDHDMISLPLVVVYLDDSPEVSRASPRPLD